VASRRITVASNSYYVSGFWYCSLVSLVEYKMKLELYVAKIALKPCWTHLFLVLGIFSYNWSCIVVETHS